MNTPDRTTAAASLRYSNGEVVADISDETSRSLSEIALEVGYTSPSHFAQVFRRVVGVMPTQFLSAL